ncbi:MAG: hypothetical protein F4X97_01075 [Boseongicola sp. SB0662_bin_57]|nr:hypothetical protein [Boseongicola sp. SB0662_bin_57]
MQMNDFEKAEDVLERVTIAVETLCVAKEDIRTRLKMAMTSIDPLLGRPQDFPTGLEEHARKISEAAVDRDSIDDDTAEKIAQDIWSLFVNLIKIVRPGRD